MFEVHAKLVTQLKNNCYKITYVAEWLYVSSTLCTCGTKEILKAILILN